MNKAWFVYESCAEYPCPCQPTLHVAVAEMGETLYFADLDAIKRGKYRREIIK